MAGRNIYLGATGGSVPAGVLEARPKPWNVLGPRSPEWSFQANTAALALGQLLLGERGDRKKGISIESRLDVMKNWSSYS